MKLNKLKYIAASLLMTGALMQSTQAMEGLPTGEEAKIEKLRSMITNTDTISGKTITGQNLIRLLSPIGALSKVVLQLTYSQMNNISALVMNLKVKNGEMTLGMTELIEKYELSIRNYVRDKRIKAFLEGQGFSLDDLLNILNKCTEDYKSELLTSIGADKLTSDQKQALILEANYKNRSISKADGEVINTETIKITEGPNSGTTLKAMLEGYPATVKSHVFGQANLKTASEILDSSWKKVITVDFLPNLQVFAYMAGIVWILKLH